MLSPVGGQKNFFRRQRARVRLFVRATPLLWPRQPPAPSGPRHHTSPAPSSPRHRTPPAPRQPISGTNSPAPRPVPRPFSARWPTGGDAIRGQQRRPRPARRAAHAASAASTAHKPAQPARHAGHAASAASTQGTSAQRSTSRRRRRPCAHRARPKMQPHSGLLLSRSAPSCSATSRSTASRGLRAPGSNPCGVAFIAQRCAYKAHNMPHARPRA